MSKRLHSPFDLKVDLPSVKIHARKQENTQKIHISTNAYKNNIGIEFGLANGGDELCYCIRHDLNELKKAT